MFKEYEPFYFSNSENNKKHLFYSYKKENEKWIVISKVFNNELTIEQTINQEVSADNFVFYDKQIISNEGTIFILGGEKRNHKNLSDNITLLHAQATANEFQQNKLAIGNHQLLDIVLKTDNVNKQIYLVSFYTEGKSSYPKGIYFSIFNETSTQEVFSHFSPLALQMTNGSSDLKDLDIKNISIIKNGGIEIVSEKHFQRSRVVTTGPSMSLGMMSVQESTRTVQEYIFDEIIVFNLKTDGSLSWNQILLKDQLSQDDEGIYSSFALLEHKLGKAYVFNDLSDKNNRTMVGYINSKGNSTIKELQIPRDLNNFDCINKFGKQISANEILIPCSSKNSIRFLKLVYE